MHSAVSLSRGIGDIKRTFSAIKIHPQRIDNCVERRNLPCLGRFTVDILERHLQAKGEGVGPRNRVLSLRACSVRFAIVVSPSFNLARIKSSLCSAPRPGRIGRGWRASFDAMASARTSSQPHCPANDRSQLRAAFYRLRKGHFAVKRVQVCRDLVGERRQVR